jgi:hypothetical protein
MHSALAELPFGKYRLSVFAATGTPDRAHEVIRECHSECVATLKGDLADDPELFKAARVQMESGTNFATKPSDTTGNLIGFIESIYRQKHIKEVEGQSVFAWITMAIEDPTPREATIPKEPSRSPVKLATP